MPTYQYACTSCGEQVEAMQRFSDDPLTVCPACGGSLRKVFSPVGIVFKGSGFYRTDSRKASAPKEDAGRKEDAGPKPAKANGSSASGEGSSAGGKKDSAAPAGSKKSGDTKSSQPAGAGSGT